MIEWPRRAGDGDVAMQDDDAPMTKPRVRAKFDEARPPPRGGCPFPVHPDE